MKLTDILLEVMNNHEIEIFKDEALKVIPNIKLKPDTYNKFGYPVFVIGDKEYELSNVRKLIKRKKIETILRWLVDNGYATNVKNSNTTDSKYFMVNGKKVRLSDHENPRNEFDGLSLPIRWDSSVEDSIEHIVMSCQ